MAVRLRPATVVTRGFRWIDQHRGATLGGVAAAVLALGIVAVQVHQALGAEQAVGEDCDSGTGHPACDHYTLMAESLDETCTGPALRFPIAITQDGGRLTATAPPTSTRWTP
ncbi:MAG: hypothetical protein GY913_16920 [Proteobacteria bacterium]|nr:hypothetical protein [Pseudomonadota bacterium]MCP4918587.1 hypothetical protein [Pseudomonadota bacterium]